MRRSLYLLCGGQSRRMGEFDKALLRPGAESLLEMQLRRCRVHFRGVKLLSGNNAYAVEAPQLPDALPEAGPLSGLLSALRDARQETIALIPVDVPLLSDETLAYLASQPLPESADALLAASAERLHPLVGIFTARVAKLLAPFLQDGGRSVMQFTERIDTQTFVVAEEELCNVNTPDDYARLLRLMEARPNSGDGRR